MALGQRDEREREREKGNKSVIIPNNVIRFERERERERRATNQL